jgi:hypothetical protein
MWEFGITAAGQNPLTKKKTLMRGSIKKRGEKGEKWTRI